MSRAVPLHWQLFKKNVSDSLLLWAACGACLFLFGWIFVIVNASWDMESFKAIIDLIPESFQKLAPVPLDQITSFDSRLSIFFEDPLIYVLMSAWCISRCSDTVSGQLSAGTMEMLLAQPITRSQALLTPSAVSVLGALLLTFCAWAGLQVGIQTASVESSNGIQGLMLPGLVTSESLPDEPTPLRDLVDPRLMLPAFANLFCLGFFLCGVTTLLSACDRYRWRTVGLAIALVVVSLVFEILAQAIDALSWLKAFTFFRAYEPVRFVTDSVATGTTQWSWLTTAVEDGSTTLGVHSCNAILVVVGVIAFGIALNVFRRRDLPAPL